MAMAAAAAEAPLEELSADQARDVFDAAARHYLGLTGDDFLAAWRGGEFDGTDRPKVLAVVMLLPLVEEPVAG